MERKKEIRIALVGVGNCSSSLVQGIVYYKDAKEEEFVPGVMHVNFGEYKISDIHPVVAFDIDSRKVGKDLSEAIFAEPNCTLKFSDVPYLGVKVLKGPVLDGVSEELVEVVDVDTINEPVDVAEILKKEKVDVLVNNLPTGSSEASRYYAEAALKAGVAIVNGMPELIVSDKEFAERAKKKGVPLVGDDYKSQIGATIVNRALFQLCQDRGVKINEAYQLNYAGNTDFINLVTQRGKSKHVTKKSAVECLLPYKIKLSAGFADVRMLGDNKRAVIEIKGEKFGGAPVHIKLDLSVIDSPNSAGVVIDAIRACKIGLDRGIGGPIEPACAYLSKHPPIQMADEEALQKLEEFIK